MENTKYKSAAVSSAGALAFLILLLQGLLYGADAPEGQPRWTGEWERTFQGTHTHPRRAAIPQREKKIWLKKKNLRAQTCWVKGVGNANDYFKELGQEPGVPG